MKRQKSITHGRLLAELLKQIELRGRPGTAVPIEQVRRDASHLLRLANAVRKALEQKRGHARMVRRAEKLAAKYHASATYHGGAHGIALSIRLAGRWEAGEYIHRPMYMLSEFRGNPEILYGH
jgi:hypothetical protein